MYAVNVGDVIGERYELSQLVIENELELVHAGVDGASGKKVFLDSIRPGVVDEELTSRCSDEVRRMAQHSAKWSVPLIDVLQGPAQELIFVFDAPADTTLEQHLRQEGALLPSRAIAIVLEVARAVAFAHQLGLQHHGLRPDKILLPAAGVGGPRILDFGLARLREAAQRAGVGQVVLGAPSYSAPELLANHLEGDHRADVYSLGVLLFELLTTEVPFQVQSRDELVLMMATSNPRTLEELRPDLPQSLRDVVRRSISRDPSERYSTMDEFAAVLDGLYAASASSAAPEIAAAPPEATAAVSGPPPAAANGPLPLSGPPRASLSQEPPRPASEGVPTEQVASEPPRGATAPPRAGQVMVAPPRVDDRATDVSSLSSDVRANGEGAPRLADLLPPELVGVLSVPESISKPIKDESLAQAGLASADPDAPTTRVPAVYFDTEPSPSQDSSPELDDEGPTVVDPPASSIAAAEPGPPRFNSGVQGAELPAISQDLAHPAASAEFNEASQPGQGSSKKKPVALVLIIVILLLVIVGVILAVVLMGRDDDSGTEAAETPPATASGGPATGAAANASGAGPSSAPSSGAGAPASPGAPNATTATDSRNPWIVQYLRQTEPLLLGVSSEGLPATVRGFRPSRGITAPTYPFEIQQHEVTWGELLPWIRSHPDHHVRQPSWVPAGESDRYPATSVAWATASAYCRSLGGDLPSEEEWEFAARGAERRAYPWGSAPIDLERVHVFREDQPLSMVKTSPQDVTPGGPRRAIYDLMGNAMEWTRGAYRSDTEGGEELIVNAEGLTFRAIRGLHPARPRPMSIPEEGAANRSALCAEGQCSAATRRILRYVGFRCARRASEIPPERQQPTPQPTKRSNRGSGSGQGPISPNPY